jgi:hypothetical protein
MEQGYFVIGIPHIDVFFVNGEAYVCLLCCDIERPWCWWRLWVNSAGGGQRMSPYNKTLLLKYCNCYRIINSQLCFSCSGFVSVNTALDNEVATVLMQ